MTVDEAIAMLQAIRTDAAAGAIEIYVLHPDQGGPAGSLGVLRLSRPDYRHHPKVYAGVEDTTVDEP